MDYADEIHSIRRKKEIKIMSNWSWDGDYFIQVNIDDDAQKSGVEVEEVFELIDSWKRIRISSKFYRLRFQTEVI